MKLNIEKLEARIAPGGCNPDPCHDDNGHDDKCKEKGNNGYGNGGDDGSNAGKQDRTR